MCIRDRCRLVTSVTQSVPPGSSARTVAESRALSRTTSSRRRPVSERKSAAAAGADSGTRRGGTPSASRNSRRTSICAGSPASLNPRRSAKSRPSGKSASLRCAHWSARAVLPTPAGPVTRQTGDSPAAARVSAASSAVRPWKPRGARGSRSTGSGSAGCTAGCAEDGGRRTTGGAPAASPATGGSATGTAPTSVEAGDAVEGTAGPEETLARAAGAATAGPGSPRRISAYASASLGPGSIPSSSARSRRVRWNRSRASDWRPARYSASISSAASDSRSGCAAVSADSRAAARWCSPSVPYVRASSSTVASRDSSRECAAAFSGGPANAPLSAGPCQSDSASFSISTVSPGLRCSRASISSSSNRCASTSVSGARST